jgi:hypothetical protein
MEGRWTELKGQAKRQLQRFKRDESVLIDDKDSIESKANETLKINEDKADKHLANLHGLLKNMEGSSNVNSSHAQNNMVPSSKETDAPMHKNKTSFDNLFIK